MVSTQHTFISRCQAQQRATNCSHVPISGSFWDSEPGTGERGNLVGNPPAPPAAVITLQLLTLVRRGAGVGPGTCTTTYPPSKEHVRRRTLPHTTTCRRRLSVLIRLLLICIAWALGTGEPLRAQAILSVGWWLCAMPSVAPGPLLGVSISTKSADPQRGKINKHPVLPACQSIWLGTHIGRLQACVQKQL